MPTYEYLCQTCNHRFETWQKMTAEPLTVCPECGNSIRRVLFPAGVVFKGHGFYKTDHANAHTLPPGETKADSNGESTSTESKSSDTSTPASTPAAKSESTPTASNS